MAFDSHDRPRPYSLGRFSQKSQSQVAGLGRQKSPFRGSKVAVSGPETAKFPRSAVLRSLPCPPRRLSGAAERCFAHGRSSQARISGFGAVSASNRSIFARFRPCSSLFDPPGPAKVALARASAKVAPEVETIWPGPIARKRRRARARAAPRTKLQRVYSPLHCPVAASGTRGQLFCSSAPGPTCASLR